jgi:hypothetical protein
MTTTMTTPRRKKAAPARNIRARYDESTRRERRTERAFEERCWLLASWDAPGTGDGWGWTGHALADAWVGCGPPTKLGGASGGGVATGWGQAGVAIGAV